MPRCRKRIVCKEPDVKVFIPQQNDNSEMLIMTVDEYESIRLIDLEGFSQEECANKLGVARTIADIEKCEDIQDAHLAEAITYRNLDRESWGR